MTIWLASGNKHKQRELSSVLKGHTLKLPREAGIENFDPEEKGTSFSENAFIKAETLHKLLHAGNPEGSYSVLADDSGLCVDALEGKPGIYSARYFGINSWTSDGSFFSKSSPVRLTDHERNILLLEELAAKSGDAGRRCRFACAMVLLTGPCCFYIVQETLEGEIVPSAGEIRGTEGFGYDPVVYIPEINRTVAELSEEEKNKLSHRGKAARAIAKLL